jgi:acyl-CoA reductase-like NAD-dependent aldehyde dehydrogenase
MNTHHRVPYFARFRESCPDCGYILKRYADIAQPPTEQASLLRHKMSEAVRAFDELAAMPGFMLASITKMVADAYRERLKALYKTAIGDSTNPFDCPRCKAHYTNDEFWALNHGKVSKEADLSNEPGPHQPIIR